MNKQLKIQIEFIKPLNAFDDGYYLSQFDESDTPEGDLIEHYFASGWSKGKNPCVWFDTNFYLEDHKDVKAARVNPFFHYLKNGIIEKRQPIRSISMNLIKAVDETSGTPEKVKVLNKHQLLLENIADTNPNILPKVKEGFIAAIGVDDKELINPYFDAEWYGEFYGVPIEHAWSHFANLGESLFLVPCKQLIVAVDKIKASYQDNWFTKFMTLPHRFDLLDYNSLNDIQKCYEVYVSGLFDSVWYTSQYGSITSTMSSLHHFSLIGIYEDCNPNAYFDSSWYRKEYGLSEYQIPLVHYIKYWQTLSFNPSNHFNLKLYAAKHPDLIESKVEPLAYYLANEHEEGVYTFSSISSIDERRASFSDSALFMQEWYEAINTDLQGINISGLEHYVLYGEKEGRQPNPFFNPTWYKMQYGVVADESPLHHYLTIGYLEGNDPLPNFNSKSYLSEYSLQDIEVSALEHYLSVGRNQGWHVLEFDPQKENKSKEAEVEKTNHISFKSQLSEFGFRYSVDFNKDGVITGWIYNESKTSDPIIFEILIDGIFVQEVIADLYRSDLSVFDIKNLNHGFYINANEYALSPAYTFTVCEKETHQALVDSESVFQLSDKIEAFLDLQSFLRKQGFEQTSNPLAHQTLNNLLPNIIDSLRDGSLSLSGMDNSTNISQVSVLEFNRFSDYVINIIIPVYKGIEETKNCILSALKAQNKIKFQLTVINDKGPEPEMYEMLDALSNEYGFELLTNENNLGFVKTVNIGMKSSAYDIILLNSDTVVKDGWLDAIYFEAYESDDSGSVGTVTPMSNNATICSFPRFCTDNELPKTFDLDTLSRICQSNTASAVDLPTAHGYCMFIKRTVLNQVGYFDEQKWGMGYAEENDFSLRAANFGWRHVMTNKTFVHHLGSVSFAEDSEGFIAHNLQKLNGIYPDYPVRVRQFVKRDPVRFLRNELAEKLLIEESKSYSDAEDRSLLFVSLTIGGGTQKAVEELKEHLNKESQNAYMLTAKNGVIWTISSMASNLEATYHIENQNEYQQLVKMLHCLGIWHIHYHHVLEFSKEVWNIPDDIKCKYDVTLHDFYMICPRVNMLTVNDEYCHEPSNTICNKDCLPQLGVHASSYLTMADFDNDINCWQDFYRDKLSAARKVFTPSRDTKERILKKIPVKNIVAQYHPEPVKHISFLPSSYDGTLLRIGFIGAIGPHKGLHKVKEFVEYIAKNSLPVEVVIFGYTSDNQFFEEFEFVSITGAYKSTNLEQLLIDDPISVMFLSSIWPETFGYTYSEVISYGLPVISFNIGAIPERAQNNKNVLILSTSLKMSDVVSSIVAFVDELVPYDFEVGYEYQSIIKDYYELD